MKRKPRTERDRAKFFSTSQAFTKHPFWVFSDHGRHWPNTWKNWMPPVQTSWHACDTKNRLCFGRRKVLVVRILTDLEILSLSRISQMFRILKQWKHKHGMIGWSYHDARWKGCPLKSVNKSESNNWSPWKRLIFAFSSYLPAIVMLLWGTALFESRWIRREQTMFSGWHSLKRKNGPCSSNGFVHIVHWMNAAFLIFSWHSFHYTC